MQQINSEELINHLLKVTQDHISFSENLLKHDDIVLHHKADEKTWNILECIEHLNLYGDYYLPQISQSIKQNKSNNSLIFYKGVLGNYFAKSMLPVKGMKKMNTFKSKNPINKKLTKDCILRFIDQQKQLIVLLNLSKNINLNAIKIPITISRFIKLKLGDIFLFVINHNSRHIYQIENILKTLHV